MDDDTRLQQERDAMHQAIGECLTAWAMVELALQVMFRRAMSVDPKVSHAIWSAPRAFEIRLNMLTAAVQNSPAAAGWHADWSLVHNYIVNRVKRRNEIAHGTLVSESGKGLRVQPYLNLAETSVSIDIQEIRRRTTQFNALYHLIVRLDFARHPAPPRRPPMPEPDLLLELRKQATRNRTGKKDKPESSGGNLDLVLAHDAPPSRLPFGLHEQRQHTEGEPRFDPAFHWVGPDLLPGSRTVE